MSEMTSAEGTDNWSVPRYRLCGVPVDLLQRDHILRILDNCAEKNRNIVLANLNLHGWYYALHNQSVMNFMNSPGVAVHIDGMPIAWVTRIFGARSATSARNTHVDLIPHLLQRCQQHGWSVAFVGGSPEHRAANSEAVQRIAPGLRFKAFHGYFDINDSSEDSAQGQLLRELREFAPTLLLVGMGMPRQEMWISQNRDVISANLTMPVGGFLDYFAGRAATPPRILGKLGLEWLYRLAKDPQRLAFRYLVEPFVLGWLLLIGTVKGGYWGESQNTKGTQTAYSE